METRIDLDRNMKEHGCCGGPAPEGTSGCCVRDIEAKAGGESGCGCHSSPEEARTSCCMEGQPDPSSLR